MIYMALLLHFSIVLLAEMSTFAQMQTCPQQFDFRKSELDMYLRTLYRESNLSANLVTETFKQPSQKQSTALPGSNWQIFTNFRCSRSRLQNEKIVVEATGNNDPSKDSNFMIDAVHCEQPIAYNVTSFDCEDKTLVVNLSQDIVFVATHAKSGIHTEADNQQVDITFALASFDLISEYKDRWVESFEIACVGVCNNGSVSDKTCETISNNGTHVQCECGSNGFVALATCVEVRAESRTWLLIHSTGYIIASLVLSLSLGLLISHRKKLQNGRAYIQINLTISLLLLRLVMLAKVICFRLLPPGPQATSCEILVVLFQYSKLSSLFWMMNEGLVLFHKVVLTFRIQESKNVRIITTCWAWCAPGLIVAIAASVWFSNETYLPVSQPYKIVRQRRNDLLHGMPDIELSECRKYDYCWPNHKLNYNLLTVTPTCVVLTVNTIVATWVMIVVWRKRAAFPIASPPRHSREGKIYIAMRDNAENTLKALVTLTPILGLSWFLPIVAFWHCRVYKFVDIAENTQCFAVFWVYCMHNKHIRKSLKETCLCATRCDEN